MDRFSGRIDKGIQDITELSKKYANVACQKGMEIAQTKFIEVFTKVIRIYMILLYLIMNIISNYVFLNHVLICFI